MYAPVTIQIDPTSMPPEAAADWVAQFGARLSTLGDRSDDQRVASDQGADNPVAQQLGRLTDYSPAFAERVQRVHDALVALGYVPTLPEPRSAREAPTYLAYIDPTTARNLGNLNSRTFVVTRHELRDALLGPTYVTADSRYAKIRLSEDAAVALVVELAKEQAGAVRHSRR